MPCGVGPWLRSRPAVAVRCGLKADRSVRARATLSYEGTYTSVQMRRNGAVARVGRSIARRALRILHRAENELEYHRGVVAPDRYGMARIPDAENWTYYGESPPWLAEQNDHVVQDSLAAFERHEEDPGDAAAERPPPGRSTFPRNT